MKVFMLGWEFPPFISGGLGTACHGLTKGLDEIGVDVCFVLPTPVPLDATSHVKFRTPAHLESATPPTGQASATDASSASATEDIVEETFRNATVHRIETLLQAYGTPDSFEATVEELIRLRQQAKQQARADHQAFALPQQLPSPDDPSPAIAPADGMYSGDLITQVKHFAALAVKLAAGQEFDIIHAHDWMTYPAGLAVAKATGKPLVAHVHSTEFDRSGNNINQAIYDIERAGMQGADHVVCVSYLTSRIAQTRYGVPADNISVVYNAVDLPDVDEALLRPITQREKIVLFLGRMTMQKGPEYFLQAARKVVDHYTNVRFVMAGSGDMITRCVKLAADMRLGSYVTFTGFLRGKDIDRIFAMADLYVMPSVSEPFGIAPLEALSHNVPVIISKQSGVSEVITHALKVDFWDIDEMANKILAVLRHPPLQRTLRQHGSIEVSRMSWTDSARKLTAVYRQLLASRGN
jgi:glycogen(starch) synthase